MKDKSIKPPPGKPDRLPPRLFIALSPSLSVHVETIVREHGMKRQDILRDLALQARPGIEKAMEALRLRYEQNRGGKRS